MDYTYLFAAAAFCVLLFSVFCILFLTRNKKLKLDYSIKEKNLMDRMEKLNKEFGRLSLLYEQSQESCRKRTEFYSNITHELKTPLSVILGALQLIERKRNGQPDEDGVLNKNLRIIRHNSYRLLRLTNNLLDLTKMEAGYLKLKPVNCDLDLLLEEIVHSVMPYAAQKQLELHYVKPAASVKTAIDVEKMERILLNLLSNSIKFTNPGGTVCITAYPENDRLCISVKDTGVGIPAEMQEEVFGRYKQADSSPLLESEGCGIGLSLVKSFVALHQGGIRVISERGRGSEFIIDLPVVQLSETSSDPSPDDYLFRLSEAANIEFADLHSIAS